MSEFDREKAQFWPGIEILDRACEHILDAVYHDPPGAIPGEDGHQYDVIQLLLVVYCRRALAIGEDPQQLLEDLWPYEEAPWGEGWNDNDVKHGRHRDSEKPF